MLGMLVLLVCGLLAPMVSASPSVIADARIRDPNRTPVLGRGYSLTTYDVLSTCLVVEKDGLTEPTYNFDYSLMEVDSSGKTTSEASGSFSASVGWGFIKASISGSMSSKSSSDSKKQYIVTKMSMERYYSSVDDTKAVLTKDAMELLNKGDSVGFFQSCGSGYIRSIRRTAEVIGIFEFESSTTQTLTEMSGSLKIKLLGMPFGGSGSFSSKSDSTSSNSKMTIKIKAFGLGLNMEGSDTLVARSLEDYEAAMKFAFKSMQNQQVGMIHGIEVVSWINTLQFQNTLKFAPLPKITWDLATNRPVDSEFILQPIEIKAITTINAEFITTLEAFYRDQMFYLFKLRTCVGDLAIMNANAQIQKRQLVDHSTMDIKSSDPSLTSAVTVELAYQAINIDTLKSKYDQTTKFVQGFYGPCVSRLQQLSNEGRMTSYWFEMTDVCKPECLLPGYEVTVTKDATTNANVISCAPAAALSTKVTNLPPAFNGLSIDGIIDKYCMPELLP